MTERNLQIEYWQGRLQDLQQQCKTVQQEISATVDPVAEQKLENRLMQLFESMQQVEEQLQSAQLAAQNQQTQAGVESLVRLLEAHFQQQAAMRQAYETTVSHWRADVSPTADTPEVMVRELRRISPTDSHSALEEFVAELIGTSPSGEMVGGLNSWGKQYYPQRSWSALRTQIGQAVSAQVQHYQPAVLIRLRLAEEATTQSANTPHYQLEAWLVEDTHTYQQLGHYRTGYSSLIAPGTPSAAPFTLDQLEAKMGPLLTLWLQETRQRLVSCQNDPEFYVFLPKALLPLSVDYWPLDQHSRRPKRLGHFYRVMVCCTERLEGPYPSGPWRRLWEKHQSRLDQLAYGGFVEGSDQDLDALMEVLDDASEAGMVGLKLTAAPRLPEAEELFEELLLSGLPLAIWGRCQPAEGSLSVVEELDAILKANRLGELPRSVQRKRQQARRSDNSPERHIGHHLSLLCDNPSLIPPRRA